MATIRIHTEYEIPTEMLDRLTRDYDGDHWTKRRDGGHRHLPGQDAAGVAQGQSGAR